MNDHEHRGDPSPVIESYQADDGTIVLFDSKNPTCWIKGDYFRLDRWR